MSTRFTHRALDGDDSEKTSALEMAIDSHWSVHVYAEPSLHFDRSYVVPSSFPHRRHRMVSDNMSFYVLMLTSLLVVNDLWKGRIAQKHNDDHDIECMFLRAAQ